MGHAKSTVLGNLTRDPETRFAQSGVAVVSFSLGVNRKSKDGKEETSFIDCVMFGKRAEAFAKFHGRGDLAFVEGDLEQQRWDDKKTGEKRSKIVVQCWGWEFVGSRNSGAQSGAGQDSASLGVPLGDVDDTPF